MTILACFGVIFLMAKSYGYGKLPVNLIDDQNYSEPAF